MKNTTLLLGILSLTACTSTYEDLNKWMSDTRQEAKSHIIPFEAPAAVGASQGLMWDFAAWRVSDLHLFKSS